MNTRIPYRLSVLVVVLTTCVAVAQLPDPPEPTEDLIAAADAKMQWIQRVREATHLLAQGQVQQALASFESLQRDLPYLDADGLVALSAGDCHFHLRQYAEAARQYQMLQQQHPDLEPQIWPRLVEIEVATGDYDNAETRLQRLLADQPPGPELAWVRGRLAALHERRAVALLEQARELYLEAVAVGDELAGVWMGLHADDLEDVVVQLQRVLADLDGRMGWAPLLVLSDAAASPPGPQLELAESRISGTLRVGQGRQRKIEIVMDEQGEIRVKIRGREVSLEQAGQQQIRKHLRHVLQLAGERAETKD